MKRSIQLSIVAFIVWFACLAGATSLAPQPKFTALDSNGDPLVGAFLYTYETGTTTPKETWTDATKSTPNPNPIILDSYGQANVWIDSSGGAYRLKLLDSDGNTVWTVDGIEDLQSAPFSSLGAITNPVKADQFVVKDGADGTIKTLDIEDLNGNVYYPDYTVLDQGDSAVSGSLAYYVDQIGTDDATIVLRHNSGLATTTYALSTSETIPGNINLQIEKGALISIDLGETLTIYSPANIIAAPNQQIFDGDGSVAFSKNMGEISAENFGVSAISTAVNNAKYIQSALDSLVNGGTLTVNGFYEISTYLTVNYDSITIDAKDWSNGIQFDNSVDVWATYGRYAGIVTLADGVDNFTLKNIKLDHNFRNSGNVNGDAPLISGVICSAATNTNSNIIIDNVYHYDTYADAVHLNNITNGVIKNNQVDTAGEVGSWANYLGSNGQSLSFGSVSSNCKIIDNIINSALDDACALHQVTDGIIKGNIVTSLGGRIIVTNGINNVVTGNVITTAADSTAGISIQKETEDSNTGKNISVIGNVINVPSGLNLDYPINFFGAGETISCVGNTIRVDGTATAGIRVVKSTLGATTYTVDGLSITGNIVEGAATGIQISPTAPIATKVSISGNTLVDCSTGIQSTASRANGVNFFRNCTTDYSSTSAVYFSDIRTSGTGADGYQAKQAANTYTLLNETNTDIFSIAMPDLTRIGLIVEYWIYYHSAGTVAFSEVGQVFVSAVSDSAGNITSNATKGDFSQSLDGFASLVTTFSITNDEANNKIIFVANQNNEATDSAGKGIFKVKLWSADPQFVDGDETILTWE